jgi:hypothetical protein
MYKVVTNGLSKDCDIDDLSTEIKVDSEIFDIQNGEVYLGRISKKALIFLVTEMAARGLDLYNRGAKKNGEKDIENAEKCIDLCRKWAKGLECVSEDELLESYRTVNKSSSLGFLSLDKTTILSAAYAALAASSDDINRINSICEKSFVMSAMVSSSNSAGFFDQNRSQGEFIIDFIRTDKHLFMV